LEIPKKFELLELGKRLEMTEPLFTEAEVSAIMKPVLTGLAPVHEMDYIHRDVKPENLILSELPPDAELEQQSSSPLRCDRCQISSC
jgi:serine/threonine protein kinase